MRAERLPGVLSAIAGIAVNTFREAIRDRILYLLLVFALALITAARLLSLLTVGSEEKIIKDLGLSAVSVFGVLTAVFVGVSLVSKEIDRRTIYTLLATPVRRWHFVTGKYFGLLIVLTLQVALMTAVLFSVLAVKGAAPWGLLPAVALVLVQLAVVTAFAIFFSSMANPILSAVGTLSVYVAGKLSWSLDLLRARMTGAPGRVLCDAVHLILPNLDRLDVKASAVHGIPLPEGYAVLAAAYGGLYALAVVVLACAIFGRREFA